MIQFEHLEDTWRGVRRAADLSGGGPRFLVAAVDISVPLVAVQGRRGCERGANVRLLTPSLVWWCAGTRLRTCRRGLRHRQLNDGWDPAVRAVRRAACSAVLGPGRPDPAARADWVVALTSAVGRGAHSRGHRPSLHRGDGRHRLVRCDAQRGESDRMRRRPVAFRPRRPRQVDESRRPRSRPRQRQLAMGPGSSRGAHPMVGGAGARRSTRRAGARQRRSTPTPGAGSPPPSRSSRRSTAFRRRTRWARTCWRRSSTRSSSTTWAPPSSTSACRSTPITSSRRRASWSGLGARPGALHETARTRPRRSVHRRLPRPRPRRARRRLAVLLPVQAHLDVGEEVTTEHPASIEVISLPGDGSIRQSRDGDGHAVSTTTSHSTSTVRSSSPGGCRPKATKASSLPAPPVSHRR